MSEPVYIEISANPSHWEDAIVNGKPDEDGSLVPHVRGGVWNPTIRLSDGLVMDWPPGVEADIHYKVCDSGEYWLCDADRRRIAVWCGWYVPDDALCPRNTGYGDYIKLQIGGDGRICGWRAYAPEILEDCRSGEMEWKTLERMDDETAGQD